MRLARFAPVLLVLLLGCSGGSKKINEPPPPPTPPTPDTPINAVKLFDFGWEQRSVAWQDSVLTSNFEFIPSAGDTAAQVFTGGVVPRDTLLNIERHLFVTGAGAGRPAATKVTFTMSPIQEFPGTVGDPNVHREVDIGINPLDIKFPSDEFFLGGTGAAARFFVVRGDSAQLPAGRIANASHWYVEGVQDVTPVVGTPRYGLSGVQRRTWGYILALYR